jgi:hypothetical protein
MSDADAKRTLDQAKREHPYLSRANAPGLECTPPVKRGPGRPRKTRIPEPEPEPAESDLPELLDIRGIARIIKKSISTARRLVNCDPLCPAGFPLNGYDNWFADDFIAYLRLKAKIAQEEKEARLAECAAQARQSKT